MARLFTYFWNKGQFAYYSENAKSKLLPFTDGNSFLKCQVDFGDFIYIISFGANESDKRELHVLGRMEVDRIEPRKDSERNIFKEKAIARKPIRLNFKSKIDVVGIRKLRFCSKLGNNEAKFGKDGRVDKQTFRNVRELTPYSARVLDAALKIKSVASSFE